MNRDVSHSVGKTGPMPRFEHVKGRHTAALCSRRAGYGHLRSGSLVPVSKQVICCELERLATYMRCSSRQLTEIQSNGAGRTEGLVNLRGTEHSLRSQLCCTAAKMFAQAHKVSQMPMGQKAYQVHAPKLRAKSYILIGGIIAAYG